jgi:hypothetical protein
VQLHRVNKFLTNGRGSIPTGPFVAVGIHPSSEVDLVDVAGHRLGVGAIVPCEGGIEVKAVRNAPQLAGAAFTSEDFAGQRLVLQLYEKCDQLIPPGPRLPVFREGFKAAADIGVDAANAGTPIVRLPFHGRTMATITFRRTTDAADLTLLVVGFNHGEVGGNTGMIRITEQTTTTWWNGAVPPAVTVHGGASLDTLQARTVYVGGLSDAAEGFDELMLFVYGAAGGDARLFAEAYGERIKR